MSDFTVQGAAELERQLKKLTTQVAKKVTRRAVAAGGRIIRDRMKSKIHKVKGDLAKSIKVSTRANERAGTATASVRPTQGQAYIANFLEFGTQAHAILPGVVGKGKKAKRNALRRGEGIKKAILIDGEPYASASHPGIAPHSFMRPAADESKHEVVAEMMLVLKAGIEEESK